MSTFIVLQIFLCLLPLVSAQPHQHNHHHHQQSHRRAGRVLYRRECSSASSSANSATSISGDSCYYWLADIRHQGLAPFASGSSAYQVFRNVKNYGATGDGQTDDTAAINLAISGGNRCAPGSCASSTTTPAIVYFPPGTYLISTPIIDYYYTQLIGNPNCLPVIKATPNFAGIALIDGDPYGSNGKLAYGATNTFWRQIRNFIIDETDVPISTAQNGIHWPTGQATSLQNIVFKMSSAAGTQHTGLFIEEGSGGFMADLVFYGGRYGANIGNQQFTMRNLSFYNAVTAINQLWDWGWTYSGLSINNCQVGIDISSGGRTGQTVGSVTLFDSQISNTPVGILTAFDHPTGHFTNGSLIVENVALNNVPVAIQGPSGVVLAGSTGASRITAFGQGNSYVPNGPSSLRGSITPNTRPAGLQSGGSFYQRSKPQYERYSASQFLSARDAGATGNGVTDDTSALQGALDSALTQNKFLFIDAGDYKVTSTIYVPGGSVIVGEAYPVIIGSGPFFSNANAPQPVMQIGKPGETGSIEWSDTIVSTQGATAGAILFEFNLASPALDPALQRRRDSNELDIWQDIKPNFRLAVATTISSRVSLPTVGSNSGRSSSSGSGILSIPRSRSPLPYSGLSSSGSSLSSTISSPGPSPSSSGSYQSGYSSYSTSSSQISSASASRSPSSTGIPQAGGSYPRGPSGIWDVHARVGGFAGSNLQLAQCPTTATVSSPPGPINQNCIAAFMTMHVTPSAANLYMENVWLWVADHDVEDPALTRITIYAGRGLLVESTHPLWLWGTAVEHHTLYQYQFVNASTVYLGQVQTETAYYQPNPPVLFPFSLNSAYSDPDFSSACFANATDSTSTSSTTFTNNCDGYGLRILNSHDILTYGAGLYSFFDNYSTSCSAVPSDSSGPYGCQTKIFSIEGTSNSGISVYNLMTVGAQSMIDVNGVSVARYVDNLNVFPDGIALFRL